MYEHRKLGLLDGRARPFGRSNTLKIMGSDAKRRTQFRMQNFSEA
jgi:hypothetical protein